MSEMRHVQDLSKGILGKPDPEKLWVEIVAHIPDEVLLRDGVLILSVACGHCTEAIILAKRMIKLYMDIKGLSEKEAREKVNNAIWVLDKYNQFTVAARIRYGFKNVITADFLNWNTKMKFDVIIGNPPYNKNIVTRESKSIYFHEAMNSEKEGYVGFYIKSLQDCLSENGILLFINPGKFLVGAGASSTRKWLFKNYDLTKVITKPSDSFESVGVDKLVIVEIINRPYENNTSVISLNGNITNMNVKDNIDYIIPDFGDQEIYEKYNAMKNMPRIKPLTSKSVGEYGDKYKKHFTLDQSETHKFKVARSINVDGSINYEYTDLSTDTSNKWRVITNMSFANRFALLEPGIEHDHSKCGFIFESKEEAESFIEWVESDLFKQFWNGLKATRHTHVIIRLIPQNNEVNS